MGTSEFDWPRYIIPAVAILALLTGIYGALRRAHWWSLGKTWTATEGTIEHHSVVEGHFAIQGGDPYVAQVSYSYSVAGEYYTGTLEHGFLWEKSAQEFLERFPVGSKLKLRYREDRPDVSNVLKQEVASRAA